MVWGNAHQSPHFAEVRENEFRRVVSDEGYPMYLLPFGEFMAMDRWVPHQELKAQGKVVEFDQSMWGKVFFISHQWTSYNHPDPECDQLKSLQHVLRRLANGECIGAMLDALFPLLATCPLGGSHPRMATLVWRVACALWRNSSVFASVECSIYTYGVVPRLHV